MHRVGQTVLYTLTDQDAEQINSDLGYVAHVGNQAEAGQVLPMIIVRTWGDTPESSVNGQVFLDGNSTLWVTSRSAGSGPGHWMNG